MIVPVYNVENYLEKCLDSLVAQTIDKKDMEVLLINDGSTDRSPEICREYSQIYDFFKFFTKENEGLSATRNYGIKRAKGKYLMYIDSDDTISPDTIKSVTEFFDAHYDEIDLVTYKEQPVSSGKKLKPHFRYKYLKNTGIYSLEKYPYITQTRINICVKNLFEKNHLFDVTPDFRQEDQDYCSRVLKEKLKIGYSAKGEYFYEKSNDGSLVSKYFFAYYIFESSMKYFENLLKSFKKEVPKYYQAMFLNDVIWKLNSNKLYPYHYDNKDFKKAENRIKSLLSLVDNDVIIKHPMLDNFTKQYWLNKKPNSFPVVFTDRESVSIMSEDKIIYNRYDFEIIMHKLRVYGSDLHFLGFVKSPVYTYLNEKANVYVVENDKFDEAKKLNTFLSVHSFYMSHTQTCNFYAFSYHCDVRKISNFKFIVELDDIFYKTIFWCQPVAVFNNKIQSYVRSNILLTLKNHEIFLKKMTKKSIFEFENEQTEKFKADSEVYYLRKKSLQYRKKHRIWLYYDLHTVKKDNGYYQFINDWKYNDGVERYYIYDRDIEDIAHLFTDEQKKNLVKFESLFHKLIYISAEKVFTSFYGFSTISPFRTEEKEGNYLDIIKFETVYLQHGVLHANLILRNHAERCRADKIVISSKFERDNYIKNYKYEENELICTGMARYDHIDKNRKPLNRILFAPSWREYLVNVSGGASWDVVLDRVKESEYYNKFNRFLTDDKLESILEEEDLFLDVKLHPIIKSAEVLFSDIKSERINVVNEDIEIENYKLFITDFSSFVFDFVYLRRPVIYFVPDMEQFKSGMNHYRELDLPFEKAFGNLCLEADDTISEIERVIRNGFRPDEIFAKRMKDFFFKFENSAEGLYKEMMGE